jgi:hypothetical protein
MPSLSVILRRTACIVFVFPLCSLAQSTSPTTTFTNPPLIPTSDDALALSSAKLINGGTPDLVYIDGNLSDSSRALHVLLGNGNGTFRHSQDFSLPTGSCCSLGIADVTNDGIVDLIVAGGNGFTLTVVVLVGNGDGTFQQPLVSTFQPMNIPDYPDLRYPIVVGDINGDGKMDLLLTDSLNGTIYTLLGNNSGTFTYSGLIQTSASGPTYLVDLTGNQVLDIIATDPLGADFLVYLGTGQGTFPTFTRYSLPAPGGSFLLADVNQDGHPDILAEYYPYQLGYFPGNPNGTFGTFVPLGNSPSANQLLSAADLNGDGIPDLTFITPSGIAVALGQAGATFGKALTTITGGSTSPYSELPIIPAVGDFNTDGNADLAMAAEGGIAIFLGKGDGTFASVEFYDMGQEVGSAAVAEFSSDGNEDIAVSLPATFPRLLLGNGTGTFTLGPDPNTSYAASGAPITLLPGDFNGDGKPDLNIGTSPPEEAFLGTDSVALNAGNGTFDAPVSVPNTTPIMADFTGDGRTDILAVSGNEITVSLGQRDGSFTPVTTSLLIPFGTGRFNVGDVNGDGKPDLILNYGDHFEVWLGNGDGTFTYSNSVALTNVASDFVAAVSDLDGNRKGDIILAPDADVAVALSPLAIFYGNGDGTFQPPVFVPVSHRYSWITAADLNTDGMLDLVMTDGASIAVMMNLGAGAFGPETDYISGRSVSVPVNVVDVNGDGLPDIVVANTDGTTVTVLLNQSGATSPDGIQVSGTLTLSPEPVNYLNPFTATLSLTGTSASAVPTGTVSFSVDGGFVGTVTVASGSASWTEASQALIPGQHTITADYNGDSTYALRIFTAIQTVLPPNYPTESALSRTPLTLLGGQTVHLMATVSAVQPPPAGGTVTFYDGANSIGSDSIDASGIAYHDTSLLAIGTHTITATYQGFTQIAFTPSDATYTAAIFSASTSAPLTVVVNGNVTTTSLSPSSTSSVTGTVLTFTATVSSTAGVPFGGVSFYDGSVVLGTLGLSASGTAAFSTASLNTGTHCISASFNANGPFARSTSAPATITVGPAPANIPGSVVSLSQQIDPTTSSSTLVARVNASTGAPSGTVTFLDNGTILGTAQTDAAGVASREVGVLASGTHSLTASFAGSSAFSPNVSPELYAQWPQTGPGFGLSLSSGGVRAVASGAIWVKVEGETGFGQQVQLSCASGLPAFDSCDFSPATVAGSGVSSLTLVAERNTATRFADGMFFLVVLMGMAAVVSPAGQSRVSRLVALLLICSVLGAVSACTAPPQNEQPTVLTIRATSGSGANALVQSAQIQVLPPSK